MASQFGGSASPFLLDTRNSAKKKKAGIKLPPTGWGLNPTANPFPAGFGQTNAPAAAPAGPFNPPERGAMTPGMAHAYTEGVAGQADYDAGYAAAHPYGENEISNQWAEDARTVGPNSDLRAARGRQPSGETGPTDYQRLGGGGMWEGGPLWQQNNADAVAGVAEARAKQAAQDRASTLLQNPEGTGSVHGPFNTVPLNGNYGTRPETIHDYAAANRAQIKAAMEGEVPQRVGPWDARPEFDSSAGASGIPAGYRGAPVRSTYEMAKANGGQAFADHMNYNRFVPRPMAERQAMVEAKANGYRLTGPQAAFNVAARNGGNPSIGQTVAAFGPQGAMASQQAMDIAQQGQRDKDLIRLRTAAMSIPDAAERNDALATIDQRYGGGNNNPAPVTNRMAPQSAFQVNPGEVSAPDTFDPVSHYTKGESANVYVERVLKKYPTLSPEQRASLQNFISKTWTPQEIADFQQGSLQWDPWKSDRERVRVNRRRKMLGWSEYPKAAVKKMKMTRAFGGIPVPTY